MIIDHRTYTVCHGQMGEYLERYEREGLPIQLRYLGQYLGCFVSEIGPLNQVIHMWAYESMADREERRKRMDQDPEWQKFRESNFGTFSHQEVKILIPTKFSPVR